MNTILRGGCLCGAVRYECAADPGNASYCHCDDCKRATGGPYTVGVLARAADLRILGGQQPFLPVVAGRRRPKPAGPGAVVLGYCKRHFAFSPSWGIIGCCIRQSSARV
jgi:hypothetical protein